MANGACSCQPVGGLPHGEAPYDYGYDDPADCPVHGKSDRSGASRWPWTQRPEHFKKAHEHVWVPIEDKARSITHECSICGKREKTTWYGSAY